MDKAREEFFSEAQELIETLSRSLLSLDEQHISGQVDPSLINEAFRAVHTLKSLAGIFGAQAMSAASHRLEDALDQLRLGRVQLTRDVLDVLFQAVELYWQLLSAEKNGEEEDGPSIEPFLARLQNLTSASGQPALANEFDFDPALLAVLTEYEEHRLRSCVQQGTGLFRVRVRFDLMTIDQELDAVKARAKPLGEVITYLPTGESTMADTIELDLLLASTCQLAELISELGADNISVTEVPRRSGPRKMTTLPPVMNGGTPPPSDDIEHVPSSRPDSVAPQAVIRSVSQTVRVDIRKLDALMNAVGELALVKTTLGRIGERVRSEGQRHLASEIHRLHRNFDRRLGELQSGILEVRMVPLSQVFDRLTRVVRQISREVGKDIRLVITGGETEIDKLIVEELSDPLVHIVRNAIDHGIEEPARRLAMNKPEAGTIALNAFQKGNHVVLEIEDDGGGVNERALVERAVALGKLSRNEARDLSRAEALNLIFLPGLTTRETATDYSGRGVGMDVVKTNIGKLGGVIDLYSEPDIGTKITVTLPITLAIVSALLIRCGERVFAIPLTSVSEALVLDGMAIKRVDGRRVLTLRGASLPLCSLSDLFRLDESEREPGARQFVVVSTMGSRRLGLVVDELLGQQDLVIKALGHSLMDVRGFSGATELGDQRVALVLDVAAIIDEVLTGPEVREIRERTNA